MRGIFIYIWFMSVWKKVDRFYLATAVYLLLLMPSNYFAAAQDLVYRQYTIRDGLANSVIYDMLQDKNGYMWFATPQGVSRFDGQSFKNFSREDGLPDNEIIKLYLDKHNNVWFISFSGLPSFYQNGRIQQVKDVSCVMAVTEDHINDSLLLLRSPDKDTSKLYGNYRSPNTPGNWKFNSHLTHVPAGIQVLEKMPLLRTSSEGKINFYFSINDKKQNSLLINSAATVTKYYYPRYDSTDVPGITMRRFYRLTSNKKGLIFHSYDSLYYADQQKLVRICALNDRRLRLRNFDVNSIFCESDSTFWLCTRNQGLVRVSNFLSSRMTIEKFFPNIFCTAIMKDHENGYWISTYGDGVYYLPNLDFRSIPGERGIYTREVRCITTWGDNRVAAGFTDGNILEINRAEHSVKAFANWIPFNKNVRVLGIAALNKDKLVVAGDNGTFALSQKEISKNLTQFIANKGVYVTANNQVAMACAAGILLLRADLSFEKKPYDLRATCVTGIGNKLYWGTQNGAYEYDGRSVTNLAKKYPALSGIITSVQASPDSSLWVTTQQGVVVMHHDSTWTINKAHGLLSNMCKHTSVDGKTAWVSTDQGISRIDYRWQNKSLVYTINGITELDGLVNNDVNQTTLAGDHVYAATAKGISYFPRSYAGERAPAPMININAIRASDSSVMEHDTVMIDRGANRLFVDLSGISYKSGRHVSYEYRLAGLSNDWTSISNNMIEITAIPFGEFTLEARAVDRWGNRSTVPRQIAIINPPPFYKSTWFTIASYIFIALLIGAGFYLFSRSQQRKRDNNYRLKKKIQDLEILALRSQINPHFIFNCLSSIQYYIRQADIENSNMYLFKFSLLIRKILKNSTVPTISLQEEIEILELYLELEKLRLGSRMEYRLEVDSELRQGTYFIHSMIIQPYIENAIKHGIAPLQQRQGELIISIKKSRKYIECIVEDNGIGILNSQAVNKAVDHTSMGAGITESRIDTINAMNKNKILIKVLDRSETDKPGSGTIVHLSFPIITD